MTIYIVTQGEYSAYHIEGVFSSREKAQALVDTIKAQDHSYYAPDIEEYDLDARAEESLVTLFRTLINIKSGAIIREWNYPTIAHPSRTVVSEIYTRGIYAGCFIADSPISQEHARKIAVEHRQALLREAQ